MTQDELQHLDAELAAGRISAEEYRTRRDAALGRSQAEQTGTPSGGMQQQGPPSGGFPQQDQQSSPFPPAFSWGTPPEQSGSQQPQQEASSEAATQIVQNPLLNSSQQPGQHPPAQGGDAESTQVVNVNQVQQPQQGWNAQQGWGTGDTTSSSGTPWGDSELPPEHGNASWMRQGPEVFDTAGKSSKGKTIASVSFGAVLLVGVIVAAVLYFTSAGEEPQAGGNNQPPKTDPTPTQQLPAPPAEKPAPAATDQVLAAAPPGPPHPFNGPLTRADMEGAQKSGVMQEAARRVALSGGMLDGWLNRTEAGSVTMLLTVRMPDEAAASAVADAYLDDQKGLAVSKDLSYQGVKVVETGSGVYRTAYVAHGWAIIVEVSGASDSSQFKSVLDQQLAQTPPTVLD